MFAIIGGILKLILMLTSPLFIVIALMISSYIIQLVYLMLVKKMRFKQGFKKIKRRSIFKRLVLDFPFRLAMDNLLRDPYVFRDYGVHLYCGEQGSGKTTSLVYYVQQLKRKYPKMQYITNMGMKGEDGSLDHWKDIIGRSNGTDGMICVLDEIQAWFSSADSKNFPPQMLAEVTMQRKQRKMIIGTAQVFSRVAKPIREQVSFVHLPFTIAGCLTIVRTSKPQYWNDEKQKFTKYLRWHFFVHNDVIRDAFDTYKKVKRFDEVGHNENSILYKELA